MLHGARCEYRTQKVVQKLTSGRHHTTLSGYIFTTKARIDNRKKYLLSSNISSTYSLNMVNFGPLTAEIGPVVWAPQQISTGFASWQRYCTASSSGRQPNFAALNRGRHLSSGRAAITLGIGPHSSFIFFSLNGLSMLAVVQLRWSSVEAWCYICECDSRHCRRPGDDRRLQHAVRPRRRLLRVHSQRQIRRTTGLTITHCCCRMCRILAQWVECLSSEQELTGSMIIILITSQGAHVSLLLQSPTGPTEPSYLLILAVSEWHSRSCRF